MVNATRPSIFLICFSRLVVSIIGFSLLLAAVVFFSKGYIFNNGLILFLSFALAGFLVMFQLRREYRVSVRKLMFNFFASVVIMVISGLAITKIYDKSWDGLTYHQMAVLELSRGWNPFYERLPEARMKSAYTGRTEDMNLYINHYAKGSEIFAAVVMAATGNIESGKIFNFLLMIAAFCSVLHLLGKLNILNSFWNYVLAIAATLNPIVVNQAFSYLVDGALGSILLMLICNFILLLVPEDNKNSVYTNIFFLVILLVNFKLTGGVYLAWVSLAFVCISFYLRKRDMVRKFIFVTGVSGLIAFFVVGFNPYFVNTYNFGHPFYPIAGKNKVDIIHHVMPIEFQKENRIEKFVMSTFSTCDNFDSVQPDRVVQYKVPFTFSVDEIKIFQSEATRLCGFGVLWSGIFCLSILCALLLIKVLGDRRLFYFIVLLVAILLSVITNPESWWARFVPQLWLFPVVVFVFMIVHRDRVQQLVAKAALVLMIVNSAIIGSAYLYSTYVSTTRINDFLESLKKSSNPVFVYFDIFSPNERKFQDNHIRFIKVAEEAGLPCGTGSSFLKMRICIPDENPPDEEKVKEAKL